MVLVTGAVLFCGMLMLLVISNDLLQRRQRVEAAWAQVDNQLACRAALLPRLSAAAEAAIGKDDQLTGVLGRSAGFQRKRLNASSEGPGSGTDGCLDHRRLPSSRGGVRHRQPTALHQSAI